MRHPKFPSASAIPAIPAILFATLALFASSAAWAKAPAAPAPSVRFGNLVDGQEVVSPFVVSMTAQNLVVEPAAAGIREGHGHFHILVDVPAVKAPAPIPFDPQHLHFGKGQTETTLDLPTGEHTLTLQFAKGDHVPYDPAIAQTIRVKVTRSTPPAADTADAP
jgi:hypothetical protein